MDAAKTGKKSRKWLWVLLILLGASAYPFWYAIHLQVQAAAPTSAEKIEPVTAVSCLGRIEPSGDVVHVAGPHIPGDPHPPAVETLHVKEGDHVRRGALLATFVGRVQLSAMLEDAKSQTVVARRRLEQVKAGVKQPDLEAQQSETARLQADLENAQAELKRYEALRRSDDVTASEVEARRTSVVVLQRSIEQSTHRLESLKEIPATDVRLAEAQLQAAIANETRAQRDLDVSSILAPEDGEILKVHAHTGEEVGAEGLLDIGHTSQMYAVAEVYDTDIGRVHLGQHATVSGDLLGKATLTGTVERIAPNVRMASVLPGDTVTFTDHRIVEVRVLLDQGEAVAALIDGKVTVVIKP
jgi:HlyD family secretion protein